MTIQDRLRSGGTPQVDGKLMTWEAQCREAADRIDALEQALAWQPIETAPMDTKAMLWSKRFGPTIAAWGGYAGYNQPEFTHWMPIPQPPSATHQAE